MEKFSVQIIDDETGITHTAYLTQEAYDKASTDKAFLKAILGGLKGEPSATDSQPPIIRQSSTDCHTRQECADGTATVTSVEESSDSWTTDGTLCFITEYEKLQDQIDKGKLKQKDAFEQVANNLRKNNFFFNSKQCSTKLASLKRTYKKIKDHNNKSGNDRQTWQYFGRMENMFSRKPWIQPVATCSSRAQDETGEENSEEVPASQPKRKRQTTSLEKKLDELLEESKARRQERAEQHAEKMQRLDKLLETLERRAD